MDYNKAYETSFKASFLTSFTRSCREKGVAAGAPRTEMDQVCPCAAKTLVKKYRPGELSSLSSTQGLDAMVECSRRLGFMR